MSSTLQSAIFQPQDRPLSLRHDPYQCPERDLTTDKIHIQRKEPNQLLATRSKSGSNIHTGSTSRFNKIFRAVHGVSRTDQQIETLRFISKTRPPRRARRIRQISFGIDMGTECYVWLHSALGNFILFDALRWRTE